MDFKRSIVVNKPITAVWDILGNQFGQADRWASGLYHSEGFGVPQLEGASCNNRACETSFGSIKEVIREFDPEQYRLVYEVIEGFPGFVEQGINRWQLRSEGDQTRVDVHLTIKTKGLVGKVMSPMMGLQMKGILSKVVEDFKHYAETGSPSPRKAKEIAKRQLTAA